MQLTEPWLILGSCFVVASLSGLSILLNSNKPLRFRDVVAAVLYNGMSGLLVGLLGYNHFSGQQNPFFLVAISGFVGMGTLRLVDIATYVLQTLLTIIGKDRQ